MLRKFFCILFLFIYAGVATCQADNSAEYREAVSLARNGKFIKAVEILGRLMKDEPDNLNYRRDYIIILTWKGDYKRAVSEYEKLDYKKEPVFLLVGAANSCRHLKKFKKALALYNYILSRDNNNSSALEGKALCLAQKGDLITSKSIMRALLKKDRTNISVLKNMVELYAAENKLVDVMFCYQKILDIDPDQREIQIRYLKLMSKFGAPETARELYKKYKLNNKVLDEQIRGDYAAQAVKWALVGSEFEAYKYMEAKRALVLLERNKNASEASDNLKRRAAFDSILALVSKNDMRIAIKLRDQLRKDGLKLPAYTKSYIGDALLTTGAPRRSLTYYNDSLKAIPYNYVGEISRAYAYLEAENYSKAIDNVKKLSDREPVWLHVPGSKVYGENDARLSADFTNIMFQAYNGKLRKALKNMNKMLYRGPYNMEIKAAYAKLSLWAGKVSFALKEFNKLLGYNKKFTEAKIYKTYCLIEQREYKRIKSDVADLCLKSWELQEVKKLKRDWDTNKMWWLHSEAIFGRGNGRVLGNREFRIENMLYSPRFSDKFRLFLHHVDHWGEFYSENNRYVRLGAGVSYEYRFLEAEAEILRSPYKDPDIGLRFKSGFRFSEFVSADMEYADNVSDIPFKGRRYGLRGNRFSTSLTWSPFTEDSVSLGYKYYIFNDRNRKNVFNFDCQKQVFKNADFGVILRSYVYTSSSKLRSRHYFNPERDFSVFLDMDLWQVLKRRYDFKYAHRLFIGYGYYWQKRWGWKTQWSIKYQHELDTSDRFGILYGLAYSKRYYDGFPEWGFTYFATLNWRF